jgi:hypothetical protein
MSTSTIPELEKQIDALEKQLATFKNALDGKKDKKTAEQEVIKMEQEVKAQNAKLVAEHVAFARKLDETIKLENRFHIVEARIGVMEQQVKALSAMAGHR